MSLNHHLVLCPECHSQKVEVTANPIVANRNSGNQHIVQIPMSCECGLAFRFEFKSCEVGVQAMTKFEDES